MSDELISKQAVLDALLAKMDTIDDKPEVVLGMAVAMGMIKAMPSVTPAEKPNKWIPVSERLPKAGEYIGDVARYYLVQNEFGDMMVARYRHSEYWQQIHQLKPIGDEIVAWMPLPDPMKEGD